MRTARKPLFLIGIPTWGEHSFMFSQSIFGQIMPSNFSMQVRFVPGLEVGRARNILAAEAKRMGAEYLMFRDEDTIAPANAVQSLLYHMQTKPEITFIGGLYATKTHPPEPLVYDDWGTGPFYGWKQGEVIPVKFTGMGISLIRVADLDLLEAEEYTDRNPWENAAMTCWRYFETGAKEYETIGGVEKIGNTEDAAFFRKLEAKGLKALVDTSVVCAHYDKFSNTMFYPPVDNGTAVKPDPWNRTPRVINLGAGNEYNPYELQVDLRDGPNIDYRCDIGQLPKDWENAFDVAKAHHTLEHFGFERSAKVLAEWFRIVKPGGRIELEVPDLQAVAEAVVSGRFDAVVQGNIYGDQGHPYWMETPYGGYDGPRWLPHSFEHNHHKSGYTARFLIDLLKDIGFVDVKAERRTDNWELFVVGHKPKAEIDDKVDLRIEPTVP